MTDAAGSCLVGEKLPGARMFSIDSQPLTEDCAKTFSQFAMPAINVQCVRLVPFETPELAAVPKSFRFFDAQILRIANDEPLAEEFPPLAPNPPVLRPPLDLPQPWADEPLPLALFQYPMPPTPGFAGPSGILPREGQQTADFVPIEDRWRIGFTPWDRYGKGHPLDDDYPYSVGSRQDSYNQNVLKGDYPLVGQHTFLNITATSFTEFQTRQIPTPSGESAANPGETGFFGNPNQFLFRQDLSLSFDLIHGDAGFKQPDWRTKIMPVFDINYFNPEELGIVSPDVTKGHTRGRTFFALQEWFAEAKLADLSPNFDFLSVRAGAQPFTSDFRGFIFDDVNRGVRLFGTRAANQDQFNLIYLNQLEKDTNSDLNTFNNRGQQVLIANYYRQDFIWPGYTTQFNIHYDHDDASTHLDENGFQVRPDPDGVFQPHSLDVGYLGWTGDGHIGRINIDHAFYYAFGHDSLNPLAGQPIVIDAKMAAVELSYDRDWIRFRASVFYASGDSNPFDNRGRGFDTILDNPNFAGGQFSYWVRQPIKLFGVNLKQPNSLAPDLRASKAEGQANFVNPGLFLSNVGMDFDVTPKMRLISNCNFLWFDETAPLEEIAFQSGIHKFIGTDLSLGMEYRPWLNNNCIVTAGVSGLITGRGLQDIFDPIVGRLGNLFASFVDVRLTY